MFKPGSVVVFESKTFNQEYWDGLSEADRLKYYGALGYGQAKQKLFVYICTILDANQCLSGHCVLMDMDDQHLESMRHYNNFRLATDDEY